MKIIFTYIFLTSLPISLLKKSKSTSSESAYDSSKESALDLSEHSDVYNTNLSYKGKLRQRYAIEAAFQDGWNNVVCSPVSALLPLGKLAFGAVGRTQKELFDMIGVTESKKIKSSFEKLISDLQHLPGVKLDVASRIYVSKNAEIEKKFLKASKEVFNSGVEKISFKNPQNACDEINGWVSRETDGMIPSLLDPGQISPESSLVIVNAIYFKGKWKHPFITIADGVFQAPHGKKNVKMMSRMSHYKYGKSETLNAQIIEIPYEGMEASFIIVLPSVNQSSLLVLLEKLSSDPELLKYAIKNLTSTYVDLSIPKFSITTSLDLKNMYEKIGMQHIFKPKSGLKKIVVNKELVISSAVQKAVIEVHEKGTEAAAASSVNVSFLSAYIADVKFRADHPFLFYIQAGTEQLFSGILNDPK